MSHNITMDGVQIRDLNTLGQVVKELSCGQATLDQTATYFRTYRGQPDKCDAAIKMPGKHDIGLKKNADGSYTPVFDPYNMSPIFRADAAPYGEGHIGKLMQEYALREAEYEAAQQGYSTQRIPAENGTITLELTAN